MFLKPHAAGMNQVRCHRKAIGSTDTRVYILANLTGAVFRKQPGLQEVERVEQPSKHQVPRRQTTFALLPFRKLFPNLLLATVSLGLTLAVGELALRTVIVAEPPQPFEF